MAHFAKLDDANMVTAVHCLHNNVLIADGVESEEKGVDFLEQLHGGGRWVQTSYNTSGGAHSLGGTPMRKNYAGIGYSWREDLDAFVPPRPYDSWSLDTDSCLWNPPVPLPSGGGRYIWDEENLEWKEMQGGAK